MKTRIRPSITEYSGRSVRIKTASAPTSVKASNSTENFNLHTSNQYGLLGHCVYCHGDTVPAVVQDGFSLGSDQTAKTSVPMGGVALTLYISIPLLKIS
jgi:hypothetical protein